jgi:hypothetical protein
MLRGGRTVLVEGQTEHVDVGVLSTLGMPEWSKFPALHSCCLGFYVTSALGLITLAAFRKAQQCTPLKSVLLNRVTFKQPLISK